MLCPTGMRNKHPDEFDDDDSHNFGSFCSTRVYTDIETYLINGDNSNSKGVDDLNSREHDKTDSTEDKKTFSVFDKAATAVIDNKEANDAVSGHDVRSVIAKDDSKEANSREVSGATGDRKVDSLEVNSRELIGATDNSKGDSEEVRSSKAITKAPKLAPPSKTADVSKESVEDTDINPKFRPSKASRVVVNSQESKENVDISDNLVQANIPKKSSTQLNQQKRVADISAASEEVVVSKAHNSQDVTDINDDISTPKDVSIESKESVHEAPAPKLPVVPQAPTASKATVVKMPRPTIPLLHVPPPKVRRSQVPRPPVHRRKVPRPTHPTHKAPPQVTAASRPTKPTQRWQTFWPSDSVEDWNDDSLATDEGVYDYFGDHFNNFEVDDSDNVHDYFNTMPSPVQPRPPTQWQRQQAIPAFQAANSDSNEWRSLPTSQEFNTADTSDYVFDNSYDYDD